MAGVEGAFLACSSGWPTACTLWVARDWVGNRSRHPRTNGDPLIVEFAGPSKSPNSGWDPRWN